MRLKLADPDKIGTEALAAEVVTLLAPHCERIEVVGSIRRKRPLPRDIDLLDGVEAK